MHFELPIYIHFLGIKMNISKEVQTSHNYINSFEAKYLSPRNITKCTFIYPLASLKGYLLHFQKDTYLEN